MDDAIAAGTDTTLRLWHRFEATPERVFAAWTRPDALRLWWCPAGWVPTRIEVDLRPGGEYRLSMTRQSGTPSVTVHGRFLKIEPPRKLVYTWLWDGAFAEMPETTVTIDFARLPMAPSFRCGKRRLPYRSAFNISADGLPPWITSHESCTCRCHSCMRSIRLRQETTRYDLRRSTTDTAAFSGVMSPVELTLPRIMLLPQAN